MNKLCSVEIIIIFILILVKGCLKFSVHEKRISENTISVRNSIWNKKQETVYVWAIPGYVLRWTQYVYMGIIHDYRPWCKEPIHKKTSCDDILMVMLYCSGDDAITTCSIFGHHRHYGAWRNEHINTI